MTSSGPPGVDPEQALADLVRREAEWQRFGALRLPPPRRLSAWQRWGKSLVLFLLTSVSVFLSGGPSLTVGLLAIRTRS